jgi:hypothetical protein
MPDRAERQKKIMDKVREQEEAEEYLTEAIRRVVLKVLAEKGYAPDEIETDTKFTVSAGDISETVSTDFIIRLEGRRLVAIKCSSALDSRERHIVALSRVVDSYQIPFSVLTDGMEARVIDTISGRTVSEEMASIPSRQEALGLIGRTEFRPCPPERAEKEKRILLAFQSISCPMDRP